MGASAVWFRIRTVVSGLFVGWNHRSASSVTGPLQDYGSTGSPGGRLEAMAVEAECCAADSQMARWVDDRRREPLLAGASRFDDVTRARLLRP